MEQSFLTDLYSSLDMVVLKRDSFKHYRRISPAPDWFLDTLCSEETNDNWLDKSHATDFLDNFFIDAEIFWDKKPQKQRCINSGTWSEKNKSGQDVFFEARAQLHHNDLVLIIRKLDQEFHIHRQHIQTARENMLTNERLEEEVRRRTADIRQREEEIILRLLAASGARDDETSAHVRRIGLYCAAMGKALGWKDLAIDDIRLAAPMHDIGKIGIPDSILLKPARLNPREWKIMQTHPALGAKMLGDTDISVLKLAAEISRSHHERYDGQGYPLGLRGEKIPVSARIVSIVDVYDALVHKRVYKEAIDEDTVDEMMRAQIGKHFDPTLFEIFVDCLDEIREIRLNNQDSPLDYA